MQSQHPPERTILGCISSLQQPHVKEGQITRDILKPGRAWSTRGVFSKALVCAQRVFGWHLLSYPCKPHVQIVRDVVTWRVEVVQLSSGHRHFWQNCASKYWGSTSTPDKNAVTYWRKWSFDRIISHLLWWKDVWKQYTDVNFRKHFSTHRSRQITFHLAAWMCHLHWCISAVLLEFHKYQVDKWWWWWWNCLFYRALKN